MKRLKIYISVIFFILLFVNKLYSQGYVQGGFTGGGNLTGLTGPEKPVSFNNGYGFTGGAFLNIEVLSKTSFLFELNYLRKTFSFTENIYNVEGGIISVAEKNDFIEVPIMVRLRRGDKVAGAFINGGGVFSLLIQKSRDTVSTVNNMSVLSKPYYSYKNKIYDYGFVIGGGLQYRAFLLELRYSHSLQNLYSGISIREMRYQTLSLILAYDVSYVAPRNFRKNTLLKRIKHKFRSIF